MIDGVESAQGTYNFLTYYYYYKIRKATKFGLDLKKKNK